MSVLKKMEGGDVGASVPAGVMILNRAPSPKILVSWIVISVIAGSFGSE
jgi:hypothetical protein